MGFDWDKVKDRTGREASAEKHKHDWWALGNTAWIFMDFFFKLIAMHDMPPASSTPPSPTPQHEKEKKEKKEWVNVVYKKSNSYLPPSQGYVKRKKKMVIDGTFDIV